MHAKQNLAVEPQAYTPHEFAIAHRIALSSLYKMWSEGRGPKSFKAGRRRLISKESAAEWRNQTGEV